MGDTTTYFDSVVLLTMFLIAGNYPLQFHIYYLMLKPSSARS